MLLDLFSKTIRRTVYKAVEGQEQLPGMEDTTLTLQSKYLTEWSPDTCLEGWRVIVAEIERLDRIGPAPEEATMRE
jgi:hypothetical protein